MKINILKKCLILIIMLFRYFPTEARLCSHVLVPHFRIEQQLSEAFSSKEIDILKQLKISSLSFIPFFIERPGFSPRAMIQLALKLQYRNNSRNHFAYSDRIQTLIKASFNTKWKKSDRDWLVNLYPQFDLLRKALFKILPEQIVFPLPYKSYPDGYRDIWNTAFDHFYFGIDLKAIQRTDLKAIQRTERNHKKSEIERGMWLGLSHDSLNTPYALIQTIFRHPLVADASKVIDMGVGYGRFALYAGFAQTQVSFVGYEYLAHRMKYAQDAVNDLALDNVRFIQADFADPKTQIEAADVYITYWSNNNFEVMKTMFQKIHLANSGRSYRVVTIDVPNMAEVAPHLKEMDNNHQFSIYEP